MESRGGSENDRDRDQAGEGHPDDGIGADAVEFLLRPMMPLDQGPFSGIDSLVLGLLRGLPEEQIRRNRHAEDGHDGGEKRCAELDARKQQSRKRLTPRDMRDRECGDIGEQAQCQPLQDGDIARVIKKDLRHDRGDAEQQHIGKAGPPNSSLDASAMAPRWAATLMVLAINSSETMPFSRLAG